MARLETVTPAETAFADRIVTEAVRDGKLAGQDARSAMRLRRAAIRAHRWAAGERPRMMAYGVGGRGTEDAFRAFDDEFRPGAAKAVGCFGLGVGAFLLSIFFMGLKSWLVNTILRMIWNGTISLWASVPDDRPAHSTKEWRPE